MTDNTFNLKKFNKIKDTISETIKAKTVRLYFEALDAELEFKQPLTRDISIAFSEQKPKNADVNLLADLLITEIPTEVRTHFNVLDNASALSKMLSEDDISKAIIALAERVSDNLNSVKKL